jgi:hypothetical protein
MSDDQPLQPPKAPAGLKKPAGGGGLAKPPASKPLLGAGGGKTPDAPAKPAAPASAPASSAPAFELDDAPPAKPKAKAAAPAAAAAFDPFADQKVSLPLGGSGSGVAAPPPTASARAPSPPEDEIDIRPGAAKDLWACPHCGARNKPTRSSCRDCGKLPSDEVVVPWHRKPRNQAMVAGGVVAFILLYLLVTHVDTSLHPAGAADIDDAVRMGGGGKGERDIDGHKFDGKGAFSVSGRVIATGLSGGAAWVNTVVLGLGHGVLDEERFASWKVESRDDDLVVVGDGDLPPYVVLYLIFPEGDKPEIKKGGYLSVQGEYGYGENEEGKYLAGTGPGHPRTYTVLVKAHRE